ncbi:MAG: MBL fold metallo-hydrolase [Myxococcales bacterium]|nr:MBL fold metallo-hydrolase [Myxococcales bacterium]
MAILPSLLLPVFLLFSSPDPVPEGPGLHFIDVGQGSALLIRNREGEVVLVDSGPPSGAEAIQRALALHGVDRVALWIHSHHDADHIGGFARVVAGADRSWPSADDLVVEALWDRGLDKDDGPFPDSDALALYRTVAGDARVRAEPGWVFTAAGLRLEVLGHGLEPVAATAPENDRGLALCLELEGMRALLPGDLPAERLVELATDCAAVDLLWLSHHGALGGSSAALVDLVDPRVAVVGAGHDNGYCHPAPQSLALLSDRPLWILDGAGIGPDGGCPGLATDLGPAHALVGGDLWISPELRVFLGSPGAGFVASEPPP